MEKKLEEAQKTGNVLLCNAFADLLDIPKELFEIDERAFGKNEKWWEREPVKKIDLSCNNIHEFSKGFTKFTESLKVLIMNNNKITELSAELFELEHLTKLDLSNNTLSVINGNFQKLVELQELNLSSNAIQSIPSDLGCCSKLEKLDLSHNKIVR